MSSRPSLRRDETGNKYGSFTVVDYAGAKRGKACWSVICDLCGYETTHRGVDLRKGIFPRHECIRVCRECGKPEKETKFDKNRQVGNICLECKKGFLKTWREDNKIDIRMKKQIWDSHNLIKKKQYREAERKRLESSPIVFLQHMFKEKLRWLRHLPNSKDKRAQQKSKSPIRREITITIDEVLVLWDRQKGLCAITGMPMVHEFKNPRSVSMDRTDSKIGYVPGNVQLVCQWVNFAKNSFSDYEIRLVLEEFKKL